MRALKVPAFGATAGENGRFGLAAVEVLPMGDLRLEQ